MTPEQEKVCSLLVDTVTLLCRNGLTFNSDIKLQGLLAITVDSKNFFVVQIDEVLTDNFAASNSESLTESEQIGDTSVTIKHEPEATEIPLANHKRPQKLVPKPERACSSKILLQQNSNSDLLGSEFSDRFSERLLSVSGQVKVEDDDLILVESPGNCGLNQCYDGGNVDLGMDFMDSGKDFGDGLLPTAAAANMNTASRVRQRVRRKHMGQYNPYDAVEWSCQGDDMSSSYRLSGTEDRLNLESGNDMALTNGDWPTAEEQQAWDPISKRVAGFHVTAGGAGLPKRSSSGLKPFPCRFPGCQKRFFHETHTRRHEREAHNYYRQRQKSFQLTSIVSPSGSMDFVSSASLEERHNGTTRQLAPRNSMTAAASACQLASSVSIPIT